jgi:hypothetical protein
MSDELDLEQILASKVKRYRARPVEGLDRATLDARRQERTSRTNQAKHMAHVALRHLHPDEYAELFQQAKAKVDRERGPLPGDES